MVDYCFLIIREKNKICLNKYSVMHPRGSPTITEKITEFLFEYDIYPHESSHISQLPVINSFKHKRQN